MIFDATMRGLVVECFQAIGAHEGTVWLLDAGRDHLVPRFNSGPNAASIGGQFQLSVRSGSIGMIVSTELSRCRGAGDSNGERARAHFLEL